MFSLLFYSWEALRVQWKNLQGKGSSSHIYSQWEFCLFSIVLEAPLNDLAVIKFSTKYIAQCKYMLSLWWIQVGDRWTDPSHPCESFSCSQTGTEVEKTVCPVQTCAKVGMTKLTSVSQTESSLLLICIFFSGSVFYKVNVLCFCVSRIYECGMNINAAIHVGLHKYFTLACLVMELYHSAVGSSSSLMWTPNDNWKANISIKPRQLSTFPLITVMGYFPFIEMQYEIISFINQLHWKTRYFFHKWKLQKNISQFPVMRTGCYVMGLTLHEHNLICLKEYASADMPEV